MQRFTSLSKQVCSLFPEETLYKPRFIPPAATIDCVPTEARWIRWLHERFPAWDDDSRAKYQGYPYTLFEKVAILALPNGANIFDLSAQAVDDLVDADFAMTEMLVAHQMKLLKRMLGESRIARSRRQTEEDDEEGYITTTTHCRPTKAWLTSDGRLMFETSAQSARPTPTPTIPPVDANEARILTILLGEIRLMKAQTIGVKLEKRFRCVLSHSTLKRLLQGLISKNLIERPPARDSAKPGRSGVRITSLGRALAAGTENEPC